MDHMRRTWQWLAFVLVACHTASCAQRGANLVEPDALLGGSAGIKLPAIPTEASGHPVASASLIQAGADVYSMSGGVVSGDMLVLDGSGFTAFAIWEADAGTLDPAGFQVLVDCEEGASLWLGISDYSSESWQFSGPYNGGAPAAICRPEREYSSSTGRTYGLAVVMGAKANVEQVSFGLYMSFPVASSNLMWNPQRMQALAESGDNKFADVLQGVMDSADYYLGWNVPNDGEWWPQHQNGVMALAVAWRLSGEERYLEKLITYLASVAEYQDLRDGRPGAEDLDLGVSLTNIAIAFDWSRGYLPAEVQLKLLNLLQVEAEHAEQLFSSRSRMFYWNHAHYVATGLYAAGCALDEYTPRAADWREGAQQFFDEFESLQDQKEDAGYPEGCGYASAVYYLTGQYRELRQSFSNDVPTRLWWTRTCDYFVQTLRPDLRESIRLADDNGKYIYPVEACLRYAACSANDVKSQYWAGRLRELCGQQKESFELFRWQAALFTDARIEVDSSALPTSFAFQDLGLFVSRSSWSSDARLLCLRCGVPGGEVYNSYLADNPLDEYGSLGHMQADICSLSWWSGDAALLSDYGFEDIKRASQHNVVTFSGYGQMGESGYWWGWGWDWKPWGYGGSIERTIETPGAILVGEMQADTAYVPLAKCNLVRRRVILIRPNVLVVQDRASVTESRVVQANWQSGIGAWQLGSNGALAGGRLNVRVLGAQPDSWVSEEIQVNSSLKGQRLRTSFPSAEGGDVRFAHVFWDSAEASGWVLNQVTESSITFTGPKGELILSKQGNRITQTGFTTAAYDWDTI